jgi:uncharacterized protein (DUF362 family)
MKHIGKLIGIFSLAVILLSAECSGNSPGRNSAAGSGAANNSGANSGYNTGIDITEIPVQLISTIFVENTDGTDDGVRRLINSMQTHGLNFYELITPSDVVILKINCQWAERGGTNTDLIKSVIQAITEHPGGFSGEIIVADNGQGQFGSERRGGSLSWTNANSMCRTQSTMDVVNFFKARDVRASGVLWDEFTGVRVEEFNTGDTRNGFVVEDTIRDTGLEISYPKFVTEYGTHVSFRMGIWDTGSQTYLSRKLKVINMPVLKAHGGFQVTGAVKNYMGTPSDRLTNRRAHNSVGTGGMGTQMAHTRMPTLNIMDMIWIGVERGPSSSYANARQINKIAASIDAVALDYWASKNILIPEVMTLPGGRAPAMSPDGVEPGTFGRWLRLSMNEIRRAGYWATMDESEIKVITR